MSGGIRQDLASEIQIVLSSCYAPSGEEGISEIATDHIQSEIFVERVYRECVAELGQTHVLTQEIFFKLFDIWIGLYRLEKCETELKLFGEQWSVRLLQSWAFLRWKQGDLKEAARLFEKMESMTGPSAALYENLGHTYSSLGEQDKAEQFFNRALESGTANKGGILLGLGLVKNRRNGARDGLDECLGALAWYEERFSHRGNMSSLEAKCSMSIAQIYLKMADSKLAMRYAENAVENFRVTCGNDSPLLSSALKVKGEVSWNLQGDRLAARQALREAFVIESHRDSLDLVTLIELYNVVMDTFTKPTPGDGAVQPAMDRSAFAPFLEEAMAACEMARMKLLHDANLGAFFKIIAELAVWANDLTIAKNLLVESIGLLQLEVSMESEILLKQAEELIQLIDQRTN